MVIADSTDAFNHGRASIRLIVRPGYAAEVLITQLRQVMTLSKQIIGLLEFKNWNLDFAIVTFDITLGHGSKR